MFQNTDSTFTLPTDVIEADITLNLKGAAGEFGETILWAGFWVVVAGMVIEALRRVLTGVIKSKIGSDF